jgi:hypothetical protein
MSDDTIETAALGAALLLVVVGAAIEVPETRPELLGTVTILALLAAVFAVRNWLDRRGSTIVDYIRRIGGW